MLFDVTPGEPSPDISYDRYSFLINGQRLFIRSGAMHYFRLPGQAMWRDRLLKLKAAGYNTVDLYFNWGYHSNVPGEYDFTGCRDVDALLAMTREVGLWVIARPGPYINAEVSGGGFPGWLLARRDLPLRHRRDGAFKWSDDYMAAVTEWWRQIVPKINGHDHILMMQIENEYSTLEAEPEPMQALYELSRQLGVKVPLSHNDVFAAGLYEECVDLYAFDNYSVTHFEKDWRANPNVFGVLDHLEQTVRAFCADRPLIAAELQGGWFAGWHGATNAQIRDALGRGHIAVSTRSAIAQGLTVFNHYLAVGGTNWGTLGCPETVTSYEFTAGLSEPGLPESNQAEARLLNLLLASFDLAATEPVDCAQAAPFECGDSLKAHLLKVRNTVAGNDTWCFFRNMTGSVVSVPWEGETLTLYPQECVILPYGVTLAGGQRLLKSTLEPVYQQAGLVVLRGNREGMIRLEAGRGSETFASAALGDDDFSVFESAGLTVVLLGQGLCDRLWVDTDERLLLGPLAHRAEDEWATPHPEAQILQIAREETHWRVRTLTPDAEPFENPPALPETLAWEVQENLPGLSGAAPCRPVSPQGLDFASNGLWLSGNGGAWYRVILTGEMPESLTLTAQHHWAVWLNGALMGHGEEPLPVAGETLITPQTILLPPESLRAGTDNEVVIFVDSLGHPKGFHDDQQQPQGLLSAVFSEPVDQPVWTFCPDALSEASSAASTVAPAESHGYAVTTRFDLPERHGWEMPLTLTLPADLARRVNVNLNGDWIGRYWAQTPDARVFYLPEGLLKPAGQNTLVLQLRRFESALSLSQLRVQLADVRLTAPVRWRYVAL
ncbi:MAG: beta-galactosidase [Candidatus Melainabacteria bacterium]